MSLPPPPGSFGSVPPNGGGGPSWGGQPQQPGQPYGAPYQGQPGGQWGPPQQWAGGPPPNKGGRGKWILISLALVAVIAVSVVATVLVLRPESGGGGGSTPAAQNGNSEFASANDTGPANIITEDPTCEAWGRIARENAATADSVKWNDRDSKIPAAEWTPEQRTMYETVGKGLSTAADQTASLQRRTPHRVMRELYGQFIAYSRKFVAAIPSYDSRAEAISNVASATLSGLASICSAIDYDAAQPLELLVPGPNAPSQPVRFAEDSVSDPFITELNAACADWVKSTDQYDKDVADWIATDPKVPAAEWTPEQRKIYESVTPIMTNRADEIEHLGRQSGNAVFEDIAVMTAQYLRGFVAAIPQYTARDNLMTDVVRYISGTVFWACKAAP